MTAARSSPPSASTVAVSPLSGSAEASISTSPVVGPRGPTIAACSPVACEIRSSNSLELIPETATEPIVSPPEARSIAAAATWRPSPASALVPPRSR